MPGVFERNLDSLRTVSPALAQQIEKTPVPEGYARLPGTDSTETFARIHAEPGAKRIDWLGSTSMPKASAAPIVASLNAISAGANGLGLTIGTGYEWLAFLVKIPAAQMLYVFEPDPAHLRMALEIADLSAPLAARRLVLLPPDPRPAADWLITFLTQNPGFEPPTVIHPPPTLAGPKKNELLAAGESITRPAVLARHPRAAAVHKEIVELMNARPSGGAQVRLAFLLTPRYPLERPITAAATDATTIFIDRHDSASTLLRLELLAAQLKSPSADSAPNAGRILSDLFREQLATVPPAVPVETWVPPIVGPAYWDRIPPAATLAAADRIVVHAGHHAAMLQSRGIPPQHIILCPLHPPKNSAPITAPQFALRHRVALLADLPPMDAQTLAIQLPTHQAVFSAARDLIAGDYLAVHPGMASDILRRALSRAGVDPKTQDPGLGEPMLRIIRDVLIPHLPLVTLAETLAALDVPLLLLGDWPSDQLAADGSKIAAIPFADYSHRSWDEVALFAHLSPAGIVSPFFWEAVAAGICIAAPEHPADTQPGALPSLLPAAAFAHISPNAYVAQLKQLLRDAARATNSPPPPSMPQTHFSENKLLRFRKSPAFRPPAAPGNQRPGRNQTPNQSRADHPHRWSASPSNPRG